MSKQLVRAHAHAWQRSRSVLKNPACGRIGGQELRVRVMAPPPCNDSGVEKGLRGTNVTHRRSPITAGTAAASAGLALQPRPLRRF